MQPELHLHRSRLCTIDLPGIAPAVAASLLGLCLTAGFWVLTTAALTRQIPAGLEPIWVAPMRASLPRILLAVVGMANGILSLLVTIGYSAKALSLIGHRLGWIRVRESEGPCQLVEEGFGLWGLELELEHGDNPGAPWPPTERRLDAPPRSLLFRVDEASAGLISHTFDPGEILCLRWCDLPNMAGGPCLLEIRSAEPGSRALPLPAEEQDFLAA